ncbi:sodium:solute symporter family protein [Anaeromicrobium sediminis]|nr:sodium:solute symporter family protein [Anaeromicrobium sediminis]
MINWTILLVLLGFLGAMLAVGAWAAKKQKTAADFYVGGRNFNTLTVTATQVASAFGGGMMVAHVGLGYKYGFAEFAYTGIATAIGVLLLATLVAGWLREQDFYTTTDWMCSMYGDSKTLRAVTSVTATLVTLGWWVSQPIAAGKIMNLLTGIPINVGIIISAVVVVIYTMSGGIIAVAYTDVAQLGLMLFGMLILFPIAVVKAGGFNEIFAAVPQANLGLFAPGKSVVWGWILAVLPGQMVLQIYHQRIYAAKSTKVAKQGLYNLVISCVLAGTWASLLGMAIYKLAPDLADKEMAMSWAITNLLPKTASVIMLAGIVAAIVSTADSALHSTSASITRDFYQNIFNLDATDEDILKFSKKAIIVLGVVGVIIGIYIPMVLKVLVLGYTLTSSGLLFPLFLGRFWKRATTQGAIAGMISGVGSALLFSLVPSLKAMSVPAIGAGLITSLITMVVFSLITKSDKVKADT